MFSPFWLGNVFRATTQCTFATSQLPRALCTWGTVYILKCASHIFAPQSGALFQHLTFQIFQKCSDNDVSCACWLRNVLRNGMRFSIISVSQSAPSMNHEVFLTFWVRHVLRTTTARNSWSLIWPDASAPAALASLLLDPPKLQNIGKTQSFTSTFPRTWIQFFCLPLLWSFFFCLPLLWLFPPLLFHLSILSEVWPLNLLRSLVIHSLIIYINKLIHHSSSFIINSSFVMFTSSFLSFLGLFDLLPSYLLSGHTVIYIYRYIWVDAWMDR